MAYRARVVDRELLERLDATGAVLVEGPRASGKTETARQAARSEVLLDVDRTARAAIALDPALVLPGPVPRLIDEWQVEPDVWNQVRREVDRRGEPGQFILTGSAVPIDDVTRHTGAGRVTRLRMRPMSLFETGHSTGEVSLRRLIEGEPARAGDPGLTLSDLVERIAVGGWPGLLERSTRQAIVTNRGYVEELARIDLGRVDGVRRDPARIDRLLRALARNVATHASARSLAAEAGGADGPMRPETASDYLAALTRLMVVEDQPAWEPDIRSRSRLRSAAKRHFVDPSLAVAALRLNPARLIEDPRFLGFLFESLVVRDLRVYAQALDGVVFQYRDNTGLEVDTVLEFPDGRWAAFEIKLGATQADAAAASLARLASRVNETRTGRPVVLGVITGTGYGYVRADGIAVIPIGSLAP